MKPKKVIAVTRARVTGICEEGFSCLQDRPERELNMGNEALKQQLDHSIETPTTPSPANGTAETAASGDLCSAVGGCPPRASSVGASSWTGAWSRGWR